MDAKILHDIDKRLLVLETRSEVLPEIRKDLKELRAKLEAQQAKQAATAATIAIIVSILFSLLKGESNANHRSVVTAPPVSQKNFSLPRPEVKRADR